MFMWWEWSSKDLPKVKVAQLCPTLCHPVDIYSPWNSPGQNAGVGSLSLLQGIFPTQRSNPGLPALWVDSLSAEPQSESEVAQSCPTLCDPVDCILPGSSVHGILQARILEWVAISFSRGSSPPRDKTQVSHIAGRHCNLWATREAPAEPQVKPQTYQTSPLTYISYSMHRY